MNRRMNIFVILGVIFLGFFFELGATMNMSADSLERTIWFFVFQLLAGLCICAAWFGILDIRHMKRFVVRISWMLLAMLMVFFLANWFKFFVY